MPSFPSDIPFDLKQVLNMSPDQVDDILFGVGAGMADSESGFVRGFGKSMAAVAGRRIEEKQRQKQREERMADIKSAREMEKEDAIAAEERKSAMAKDLATFQMDLKKTERKDIAAENEAEAKKQRDMLAGLGVFTLEGGFNPAKRSQFKLDLMHGMGGSELNVGGSTPSTWSDDDLFDQIASGMGGGYR